MSLLRSRRIFTVILCTAALAVGCTLTRAGTSAGTDHKGEPGVWGRAAKGLQSRIVLLRRKVNSGEQVQVKLQVRNIGTKPVAYDPRGWESFSLWHMHGRDMKRVPDRH